MWIGTDTGVVFRLDRKTGSYTPYYPAPDRRPIHGIIALYEDHHGALWVSTSGQGVAVLDAGSEAFRYYRGDPRNPESVGRCLSVRSGFLIIWRKMFRQLS